MSCQVIHLSKIFRKRPSTLQFDYISQIALFFGKKKPKIALKIDSYFCFFMKSATDNRSQRFISFTVTNKVNNTQFVIICQTLKL